MGKRRKYRVIVEKPGGNASEGVGWVNLAQDKER
jgi:hypothetical protein